MECSTVWSLNFNHLIKFHEHRVILEVIAQAPLAYMQCYVFNTWFLLSAVWAVTYLSDQLVA